MKLRIVSNGTAHGTRVEDAETGALVDNVVGATWEASIYDAGPARVTLTLIGVEVDAVGEVEA